MWKVSVKEVPKKKPDPPHAKPSVGAPEEPFKNGIYRLQMTFDTTGSDFNWNAKKVEEFLNTELSKAAGRVNSKARAVIVAKP